MGEAGWVSLVIGGLVGLLAGPAAATEYRFTTIDVPFDGVTTTVVTDTGPGGALLGVYLDAGGRDQGFQRIRGRFTPLLNVIASARNVHGDIVGFTTTAPLRGFLFSDGTYTPLIVPPRGLTDPPTLLTEATGITDAGMIVGDFRDATGFHGFVYDPNMTPTWTVFDVPWPTDSTGPNGVNNAGTIVGSYLDPQTHAHGFVRRGGTFTILDAPGASDTELFGINDQELIVGDASGTSFLYDGTTFFAIVLPGATQTSVVGITQAGELVGFYLDTQARHHGFVARPVKRGGVTLPPLGTPATIQGVLAQADQAKATCLPMSRRWRCRHP
jgi:hypothetical protein